MKQIILGVVLIASVAMPFALRADEEADRKKLISSAENTVGKIVGEIRGFSRDGNAQDVTDAVKLSLAVLKDISALKRIEGDDEAAQEMAKTWPGEVKKFHGAAVNLAKLKNEQIKFSAKGGDYVPLDCKKQLADLKTLIGTFVPNKDPDGLTEIPALAKRLGSYASAAMSRARTTSEAAQDWEGAVARYSGAGKWDPVSDAMKAEAKAIENDVIAKRKTLDSSCKPLALGLKNPDVVAARKVIAAEMGEDFVNLQEMVDAWEAQASSYFKLDCQTMKQLHALYCNADIGDPDNAGLLKTFQSETGRLTGKMKSEFSTVMKQLEKIVRDRKKLEAEEATRKQALKIYSELDDELKKMEALEKKGSIQGMNLPAVQYYIKFGKEMHAKMERRFSCNVRDVAYPGGRERPDCVSAKACYIFEFKPNSSSAISKGRGQVSTHKKRVDAYYKKMLTSGPPESKYGGKAIMAEFEKSGCIKSGKFAIKTDIKTYNRCEEKYQCIR